MRLEKASQSPNSAPPDWPVLGSIAENTRADLAPDILRIISWVAYVITKIKPDTLWKSIM
jgi:hypothetical protein